MEETSSVFNGKLNILVGLFKMGIWIVLGFCLMKCRKETLRRGMLWECFKGLCGVKEVKLGRRDTWVCYEVGIDFDLVVGSSLAHIGAQNRCSEGALDQFNLMKLARLRPDKITFVSVISTCSELATLGQGQQTEEEKSDLGRGRRSTRFKSCLKEPTPSGGVTRKKPTTVSTPSHTEVVESCPVCRETAIANNACALHMEIISSDIMYISNGFSFGET
ncbi:hypothetical protein IFM89_026559 [Coptis chinensis]|uniref:Uncharacterized protein n=1 Tax=Coptis chinensis TaxID=261450 RepID=A0A835HH98_9MAGN|nr:hypothetical protein IFM89_026559 [Coptis chinensis]